MLNADASRVGAGKIARPACSYRGGFWNGSRSMPLSSAAASSLKTGRRELLCILLGLPGVDQPLGHQSSAVEPHSTGSSMPSLIDSRMPGTDSRNSVS